jgi:hypothetical protein
VAIPRGFGECLERTRLVLQGVTHRLKPPRIARTCVDRADGALGMSGGIRELTGRTCPLLARL